MAKHLPWEVRVLKPLEPDVESDYRSIGIFHDLEPEMLRRIADVSYLQTFPPEVTLVAQGRSPDFVHCIMSGHVEIASSEADHSATLLVIGAGEIVPPSGLLAPGPSPFLARTLTRSRIMMSPVAHLRALMAEEPRFLLELLR